MSDHLRSLFDDDDSPPSPSPQEIHTNEFWAELKTQTGANTIGNILQTTLSTRTTSGKIFCCSIKSPEGYRIVECTNLTCPTRVPVYYLHFENFKVTSALRAAFEGDCSYFMTCRLTGCRFVVTDTQVLHVANEAVPRGGGMWSGGNSGRRTVAEQEVTGTTPTLVRRASVSLKHDGGAWYGETALAFGMKVETIWKYKILVENDGTKTEEKSTESTGSKPTPSNTWITLIG